MQSKESIQQELDELKNKYGDWTYDIPLPFNIWTRGNRQIPHTRLRRIVQIVKDLSGKPLNECRILDLGCLDGIFSIEFALHGAYTIGVEIREANLKKAIFCKEILELNNLDFRQDDVRNLSLESYGKFDFIICSGILYHLPAADAINLIQNMFEIVNRGVVIDTHVALIPKECFLYDSDKYWGISYREYPDDATPEKIAKFLLASAVNPISFWFTRPSLINILSKAGFSSVYECFIPAHLNFGRLGIESKERCTFVALKDDICEIKTSPSANGFQEKWPEYSLAYTPSTTPEDKPMLLYERVLFKLKKMMLHGNRN
ncbi:MAG: class I SAM-dependent methyltransferase [Anaerolineales bacterium]